MIYNETVMEHFLHPRNMGELPDADGVGEAGNPICGDVTRIYLKVGADGRIEKTGFKTFGCGAAVAASSVMTGMMIGKTPEEAGRLTSRDIIDALGGLPPEKLDCSMQAAEAAAAAVRDYQKKGGSKA